jgi:cellulose synthase/poly-beta-1,6-N-acetylglucosamine synthase-like glycosyltransferase
MSLYFLIILVFWFSVLALGYTYAGYPALVFVVSRLFPRIVVSGPFEPFVSVIITAYNEERDLRNKLENTLALDYPTEKLEVIVSSDCSTDRTDEIAAEFASIGVRLHRQAERLGKTAAQNAAVSIARGEIILFSDATTIYEPDVLRVMLPSFSDESVGCVAGRLIYVDPAKTAVGHGARSYWGYETFIKQCESRIGSLIGASGCLYALRRSAYVPLYNEACSDFLIATTMVEQNLRVVFEPEAVCTEETNRQSDRELHMRVRVIAQTLNDLWRHRSAIDPFRTGFYGLQLFSHKVLRYFVPVFLLALFISSAVLVLRSWFFFSIFLTQACVYTLALAGYFLERLGYKLGLISFPFYFCLANIACCVAVFRFLTGERYAQWEPIREHKPASPSMTNSSAVTSESKG